MEDNTPHLPRAPTPPSCRISVSSLTMGCDTVSDSTHFRAWWRKLRRKGGGGGSGSGCARKRLRQSTGSLDSLESADSRWRRLRRTAGGCSGLGGGNGSGGGGAHLLDDDVSVRTFGGLGTSESLSLEHVGRCPSSRSVTPWDQSLFASRSMASSFSRLAYMATVLHDVDEVPSIRL